MNSAIFLVSCRNCFPAAESRRHCVAPGGEQVSAFPEPPREAPGSKDTPARFAFGDKSGLSLDGRTNSKGAGRVL